MMHAPTPSIFAFVEPDHLTRIHLRIELENLGFAIREHADDLYIVSPDDVTPIGSPITPAR